MHRTTTTAALLVTVAVSALSGCTTVPRPPVPGPPAPPSTAPAQRPDRETEPQIVQAPAREALELIAPAPRPATPGTPAPRQSPPAHSSQAHPDARPEAPRRSPEHRRTDPPRPATSPARPAGPARPAAPAPPEIPDVSRTVREQTDVCALGTRYGGWRPDSPESRTCEKVYGRR
ncbi:hypothetical protein [Streptomyces flavalbus]|uniref:Lipoprotein n=1 Tax=Streptomyces flavalbus TaxID=2665155 RepID=A0ABW2W5H4_9ACTN